jgi:hypothetical protein
MGEETSHHGSAHKHRHHHGSAHKTGHAAHETGERKERDHSTKGLEEPSPKLRARIKEGLQKFFNIAKFGDGDDSPSAWIGSARTNWALVDELDKRVGDIWEDLAHVGNLIKDFAPDKAQHYKVSKEDARRAREKLWNDSVFQRMLKKLLHLLKDSLRIMWALGLTSVRRLTGFVRSIMIIVTKLVLLAPQSAISGEIHLNIQDQLPTIRDLGRDAQGLFVLISRVSILLSIFKIPDLVGSVASINKSSKIHDLARSVDFGLLAEMVAIYPFLKEFMNGTHLTEEEKDAKRGRRTLREALEACVDETKDGKVSDEFVSMCVLSKYYKVATPFYVHDKAHSAVGSNVRAAAAAAQSLLGKKGREAGRVLRKTLGAGAAECQVRYAFWYNFMNHYQNTLETEAKEKDETSTGSVLNTLNQVRGTMKDLFRTYDLAHNSEAWCFEDRIDLSWKEDGDSALFSAKVDEAMKNIKVILERSELGEEMQANVVATVLPAYMRNSLHIAKKEKLASKEMLDKAYGAIAKAVNAHIAKSKEGGILSRIIPDLSRRNMSRAFEHHLKEE